MSPGNYEIGKDFDFCYGHRVWNQQLNDASYSVDTALVCRHLHGHQGKVIVSLEAEELIRGMVTDFKNLNWFKKLLDDNLDHKFIIDSHDPLINTIIPGYASLEGIPNAFVSIEGLPEAKIINPELVKLHGPIAELTEGFVIVNFVPTSENLSKWLYDIVKLKMVKIGIRVSKVEFQETPKSRSVYSF